MSWKTIDRTQPAIDPGSPPVLDEAVRAKIRSFFPRYETRRAVLLPALHIVQEKLGYISPQAMKEIAELLEITPSDVLDVVSFYTHFWDHPKGRKVIVVCRSLTCELLGGKKLLQTLQDQLQVADHGTSADGAYTLMTEECLAACDHAPCMLINERMHHRVRCEDVAKILADPNNTRLAMPRSTLFDPPEESAAPEPAAAIERTSDIREMREAE